MKSLNHLPNYLGVVHRGISNLRLGDYQKVGDCFYWKSFTSTSTRKELADFYRRRVGTVFHINSLTGKDISLFSIYEHEKEVLFYPFTFFLVERVEKQETYDEVWLSEMPTPVAFANNLIIWVDDIPQNNTDMIKDI